MTLRTDRGEIADQESYIFNTYIASSAALLIEMAGVQSYKLGDWRLQSGQLIPDAQIAFKTFGDPTSPTIIYPSWFSGCRIRDNFYHGLY